MSYLENDGIILMAHRGGNSAGKDKENTLAAFQSAYDLGFRYFETDVMVSADKTLYAYHGASSLKESSRTGLLLSSEFQKLTDKQLLEFKVGGEPLVKLSELLEFFPQVKFNIDIKTDEAVSVFVEVIKRAKAQSRICIASFNAERVATAANSLGGYNKVCTILSRRESLRLIFGINDSSADRPQSCLQVPLRIKYMKRGVPSIFALTKRQVASVQSKGKKVIVWTVNSEKDMNKSKILGVDGIISDETELLINKFNLIVD